VSGDACQGIRLELELAGPSSSPPFEKAGPRAASAYVALACVPNPSAAILRDRIGSATHRERRHPHEVHPSHREKSV
jgi:hypothetical protein